MKNKIYILEILEILEILMIIIQVLCMYDNLVAHTASEGRNSCRVPIFTTPGSIETIVDKMPCLGAYAPNGIRTHDPLDYKSRARTTTPQCSHSNSY